MDRAGATTYLTSEFGELATDARFTDQHVADAYSAAIDMALRQLGFSETDLATAVVGDDMVLSYLTLLQYYALKRYARVLSVRFDVNVSGAMQAMRSQAYGQVKTLLAEAEQQCLNYGFDVNGPAFQMGRVTLDFNEPSLPSEFYSWGTW